MNSTILIRSPRGRVVSREHELVCEIAPEAMMMWGGEW